MTTEKGRSLGLGRYPVDSGLKGRGRKLQLVEQRTRKFSGKVSNVKFTFTKTRKAELLHFTFP
jgi:hypothetical protein